MDVWNDLQLPSLSHAVGSDVSQTTVDSAAVFLFTLFHSDPQWTRRHTEEIRRTLGPYPASAVSRVRDSVKKIHSWLPEGTDILKDSVSDRAQSSPSGEALGLRKKEFGYSITFTSDDDVVKKKPLLKTAGSGTQDSSAVKHGLKVAREPLQSKLLDSRENGYDSLSDDEDSNDILTTALLGSMASGDSAPPTCRDTIPGGGKNREPSVEGESVAASVYNAEWLRERCKECTGTQLMGVSWQDLFQAVFEHLSSSGDNLAIQNDVRQTSCERSLSCVTSVVLNFL